VEHPAHEHAEGRQAGRGRIGGGVEQGDAMPPPLQRPGAGAADETGPDDDDVAAPARDWGGDQAASRLSAEVAAGS
jgi:hypothetical protein